MDIIPRKQPKLTEADLAEQEAEEKRLAKYQEDRQKEEFLLLSMNTHDRYYSTLLAKEIVRVQSGWIYSDYDDKQDILFNSIFVPDTRD